ncbi:unnamed protein product [Rotaria sp. Silwood1]|nr:unnamed protein product [Rotaria sp. Silwood1]
MTQFDSIVYLDCDTVVLNDVSHLHELVMEPWRTGFEFAAATDDWRGIYINKFNAGVFVLHPPTPTNIHIQTKALSDYIKKKVFKAFYKE